ncbi:MAG TPA: NAD(+) diphosphatase [Bacteroidales bacterium]|nr:NAD(+) diphosphatase [Bacteroidales bacterium]
MKYIIVNTSGSILLYNDSLPQTNPYSTVPRELTHNLNLWRPDSDAIAYGIDAAAPDGYQWVDLRSAWLTLTPRDFDSATHGVMWVHWERTTRFCPACGTPLLRSEELTKHCPQCGKDYYPNIAPAIIVRVDKGEKTLLARAALRPNFFGLISGFVEGGETFEQCVVRELREETGIEISNLTYFGSQSWPFPSGIMIGFTADYAGGEIKLGDGELLEADFYTRQEVLRMNIPKPFSISRHLIDQWLNKQA